MVVVVRVAVVVVMVEVVPRVRVYWIRTLPCLARLAFSANGLNAPIAETIM